MIALRNEARLKSALMKEMRKQLSGAVLLRHEDQYTSGIPDISTTFNGYTVWWEVKHAKPSVHGRGIQHFTCNELARNGKCFYIVYHETKHEKQTLIVHPQFLDTLKPIASCKGFNHSWVITHIKATHDYK
jgi:hypothetical protein|tara:strand:+ start:1454 stop:1846 length:393 start_codon:yes stop_codon:yes gene_type:complete